MRIAITESHRTLLYVLFALFETLLVASIVLLACIDPRSRSPFTDAAGVLYWFAFIGLFTVCFILRRTARRLAVIGWLSLFGGILAALLMPAV
jgi:hypothetical protein